MFERLRKKSPEVEKYDLPKYEVSDFKPSRWGRLRWIGWVMPLTGLAMVTAGSLFLATSRASFEPSASATGEPVKTPTPIPGFYLRDESYRAAPSLAPASVPFLLDKRITLSWKDPRDNAIKPLASYLTRGETIRLAADSPVQSWDPVKLGKGHSALYQGMSGGWNPVGPVSEVKLNCLPNLCTLKIEKLSDEAAAKSTDPIKGQGDESTQGVVTVLFRDKAEMRLVALGARGGAGFSLGGNSWRVDQGWSVNGVDLTQIGRQTGRGSWSETFTLGKNGVAAMLFEDKPVWVNTPPSIKAARNALRYD